MQDWYTLGIKINGYSIAPSCFELASCNSSLYPTKPDFGGMILQVHDVIWLISGKISLTNSWRGRISPILRCGSTLVVLPLFLVSPMSPKTSWPIYMFEHITAKYGRFHRDGDFFFCVWFGLDLEKCSWWEVEPRDKVVVRWRTATATATDNKWDNDRAPCGETYSAKYDQTIWRN